MKPQNTLFIFLLISSVLSFFVCNGKNNRERIEKPHLSISWASSAIDSWTYTNKPSGKSIEFMLPVFEIDGKQIPTILNNLVGHDQPKTLRNGAKEYRFEGTFQRDTSLQLQIKFRMADDNPVVRFNYTLKASKGQKLTKQSGKDDLAYLSFSMKDFPEAKEISLSVFNEMIHSCNLTETGLSKSVFTNSGTAVGLFCWDAMSRTPFCLVTNTTRCTRIILWNTNFFQIEM